MRFPAIVASLLLAASASRAGQTLIVGNPVARIPVVATIDELMRTEVLHVDGAEFHVGIEADTVAGNDGMLVYVAQVAPGEIAETKRPVATSVYSGSRIGPVTIEVVEHLDKPASRPRLTLFDDDTDAIVFSSNVHQEIKRPGKAFYAFPVRGFSPGKYDIRILNADHEVIALTTVTVTDRPAPLWLPLSIRNLNGKAGDNAPLDATVELIAALPALVADKPRPMPADKLPALIPAPSADFVIQADAGNVTLTLGHEVAAGTPARFLARLWVNGRPFTVQKYTSSRESPHLAESRTVPAPATLQIRPDIAELRIKETDKVEIQLAYCAEGFLGNSSNDFGVSHAAGGKADPVPILVSNKITLQEGR